MAIVVVLRCERVVSMSESAKRLPSGKWRCQVSGEKVNGRYTRKSFTADTKREAEFLATQYALEKKSRKETYAFMTFGDALDAYVASRESVISPGTYREYLNAAAKFYGNMRDYKLYDISQEMVQRWVNDYARTHAPKTTANWYGLITAVFRAYRPEFALRTRLPQKCRPDLYIPGDAEIERIMQQVSGTVMEVPFLLAAFGPMRRGEICALKKSDIDGCVVHVHRNMVLDKDRNWVVKAPKTYAGDRFIAFPQFVIDRVTAQLPEDSEYVTELNPNMITARFNHVLIHAGVPKFRFHDLRHYAASILHALNIPDAYIMQRGGWENDAVLKGIYRHTLDDFSNEMTLKANAHFEGLEKKLHTKFEEC